MMRLFDPARIVSLRRRLVWQFLVLSAVLVLGLFLVVGWVADRASRASQDAVLGAAVTAITEGIRSVNEGLELDLPYATFSMLGAMGDERIFYLLTVAGQGVTGYEDLPPPPTPATDMAPVFYSADYRGARLRLASVGRMMLIQNRLQPVTVTLGQTRLGQAAIARDTARSAAWAALGFMLLALPVALLAAQAVLQPIRTLADVMGRRGPRDLRPVRHATPRELAPLLRALNGLIARLRAALELAETFIFEAAHRIRTPLSLVRAEAELALAETSDEATRIRLRRMVRAIGESSRSANQILDHAMVMYRTDQYAAAQVDLAALSRAVLRAIDPIAEMRDIRVTHEIAPCIIQGDERMLEIALRNLLDNAIKYAAPEGYVDLTLTCTGTEATLAVKDDGRGLSDDPAQLIGRFRRGANVGDTGGSGLGLTIVTEVAHAHRGRFQLKPGEKGGTCALLHLPLP
ncbi:sensor histidine kinase N-terminal domain-containing protein [Paracoccus sp. R86501]|uniref:sensor histidine kinase N-terminal domain-containing protein n=1 Tax=Paracoccus sp. R86501 TaxID=3101711 RepID=UPI00366CF230